LKTKFIKGLLKHNLTYDYFCKNFYYCGGNFGSHLKYYRLKNGNIIPLPPFCGSCVCSKEIVKQCYVTDGTKQLVLGKCCIKLFCKNGVSRTCKLCKEPHKNRKDDYCKECRKLNKCRGIPKKNKKIENAETKIKKIDLHCFSCHLCKKQYFTANAINKVCRECQLIIMNSLE
jgi:hypothetical protein